MVIMMMPTTPAEEAIKDKGGAENGQRGLSLSPTSRQVSPKQEITQKTSKLFFFLFFFHLLNLFLLFPRFPPIFSLTFSLLLFFFLFFIFFSL